ncbi:MAG: hypothetical protein JWL71_2077 [Acidobacteria bacterium]|nr:hypothetical protein [Acidobacteriota bacterium]
MKTALAVSLLTLGTLACGHDADRVLLDQFFAASRLRDLTALRKISTVVFEPASDGIVTSYEITAVVVRGPVKEISISAPVKMFDGHTVTKNFAVAVETGQITAISEGPALRPVEGAAVPSTPPR